MVSLSTPQIPDLQKFQWGNILSCAGRIWLVELPTPIKEAWCKRATRLNRRHVPGKFLWVPHHIDDDVVLHSINAEWEVLVQNSKRCIVHPPKRGESMMAHSFGKEWVKIGAQVLWTFAVSVTPQAVLFGRDYSDIKQHEIAFNAKKEC